MNERFTRNAGLIGQDGIEILKRSTVAVFGIGGVGSYSVEALARSGVGKLWLYDNDTVSESNINRQLIATDETVGMLKTAVSAKRCKSINPDIEIAENPIFVTKDTDIPFEKFDFIIDAVDNVTAKLHIIEGAVRNNVPIISVMGTGNKLNINSLSIDDIFNTKECPLARVCRTELRKRGIKNLPVVWSDERPVKTAEGERVPSSMTFVPAAAGLLAAEYAVKKLIGR